MHEKNTAEVEKKIEQFVNEALAFNKKHNIFVRESIKEVYEKDVDDCLPVLQKIKNSDKILDLGSGGGFPGIIIAISKPMCEIYLLEKMKMLWHIGLMTGTVLDGSIDVAFLRTDGKSIEEFGYYNLMPYDEEVKNLLIKAINEAQIWDFNGPEPAIFSKTEAALTNSQTVAVQKCI